MAKKKAIAKAKNYFNEQKEMYKQPLESRQEAISESENEEYKAYKQYLNEAATQQEETKRKSEWFSQKTDEVFTMSSKVLSSILEKTKSLLIRVVQRK